MEICSIFCTRLFLTGRTIERKRMYENKQCHAESEAFVIDAHHPITKVNLMRRQYSKGLFTAVLRSAEVVGKSSFFFLFFFLHLYEGLLFFIYCYENAPILKNILVSHSFFQRHDVTVHDMLFVEKSCESEYTHYER